MAAQKVVVEGSSVTALQLKDLFRQIADGSLGGDHLQAFIEHRNPFEGKKEKETGTFDPATFIGKGWKIVENRESLPENWDPSKTVLESALKAGENYVTGDEWLKRLADKPLLGARAFHYYWNDKKQIPKEWKGKYIFFDATVLQSPDGGRYSLYLYWGGGRWRWDCFWHDGSRDADFVSASLAS